MRRNQFGNKPYNKNRMSAPTTVRETPEQKKDRILAAVNGATADEPLTLKGVSNMSGLSQDEVRFFCDRLVEAKQINMKMIPDSFYPQQKVRAFYRKF